MSVIVELGKKRAWINSKLKIVSFHEIDGWNLYMESELRFWKRIFQMVRNEGFLIQ